MEKSKGVILKDNPLFLFQAGFKKGRVSCFKHNTFMHAAFREGLKTPPPSAIAGLKSKNRIFKKKTP